MKLVIQIDSEYFYLHRNRQKEIKQVDRQTDEPEMRSMGFSRILKQQISKVQREIQTGSQTANIIFMSIHTRTLCRQTAGRNTKREIKIQTDIHIIIDVQLLSWAYIRTYSEEQISFLVSCCSCDAVRAMPSFSSGKRKLFLYKKQEDNALD